LLNPDRHIHIIDNFAELHEQVEAYQQCYTKMVKLKQEIEKLTMDEAQKARRIDLLNYQIDEIEKAELQEGEDKEWTLRRNKIRNAERILESLKGAYELLSGTTEEGGALPMIFTASEMLESISGMDENMDSCATRLSEQYYGLSDVASDLRDFLDSFDYSAADAQMIEERLDLIYRLKRKYGETIPDMLAYLESSRKELKQIELSDELLEQCQTDYIAAQQQSVALAAQLSAQRAAAFKRFEGRIKEELSYLNMPSVAFVVDCKQGPLTKMGSDVIEFYISTNVGEPPKPMSKIASGGELSRIMLAIKNAMAEKDDIDTLIFDEIDTGVSGTSAARIGQKLKQSARDRQTICVTHSAQIAAYADHHLKIEKHARNARTYTEIVPLGKQQRIEELARIISGDHITETALENAAEMLSFANA
jgi:DNA repair protein RecN (Recombination protein N)